MIKPGVWRRGLPKGPANPDKYEVTYTAGGAIWHRLRGTTQPTKEQHHGQGKEPPAPARDD